MSDATNKTALSRNHTLSLIAGFIDSIDLTVIFTMFSKEVLVLFLEHIGKYFLFPIAAAMNLFQMGLSWHKAVKEKEVNGYLKAVLETFTACAVTIAVVGALALPFIFAAIAPIIFTASSASKTLLHFGLAVYFGYKALREENPALKQQYREKTINNTVATVAGLFATAAIATVMIAGKTAFFGLGVTAGAIGSIFTACMLLKKCFTKAPVDQEEKSLLIVENSPTQKRNLSKNARLRKMFESTDVLFEENEKSMVTGIMRADDRMDDKPAPPPASTLASRMDFDQEWARAGMMPR